MVATDLCTPRRGYGLSQLHGLTAINKGQSKAYRAYPRPALRLSNNHQLLSSRSLLFARSPRSQASYAGDDTSLSLPPESRRRVVISSSLGSQGVPRKAVVVLGSSCMVRGHAGCAHVYGSVVVHHDERPAGGLQIRLSFLCASHVSPSDCGATPGACL